MEFKRNWPQLLIISAVILILIYIAVLSSVLTPMEFYPYPTQTTTDEILYYFSFLFSIIVSAMITAGAARSLKYPSLLVAIPVLGQVIAIGFSGLFETWVTSLPGGSEAGDPFLFASLVFIWVGGGFLIAIIYGPIKESILGEESGAGRSERKKAAHTRMGIASFILGIISLFYGPFFGPFAILFGALARRKNNDKYALIGMILGAIGFLVISLIWVIGLGS
jgi:hypothetical protein